MALLCVYVCLHGVREREREGKLCEEVGDLRGCKGGKYEDRRTRYAMIWLSKIMFSCTKISTSNNF